MMRLIDTKRLPILLNNLKSSTIRRWLRHLIFPFWLLDARKKYSWIAAYLKADDAILELGSGMGSAVHVLRQHGHCVTAIDVNNASVREDLIPAIYDGKHLPHEDRAFDVGLLLTVLHHCHDPDQVLAEAIRVARRVIIVEDIYRSGPQRMLTHWFDSLLNWEFRNHPHNNRSDVEWRDSFREQGMQLTYAKRRRVALIFSQITYVLDPIKEVGQS